jgi:hypothetical protein
MLDTALLVIKRLLACCELNLDEMEPETRDAIADAEAFIVQCEQQEKSSQGST